MEQAMTAKGTALSALCRAFDLLETRKRIMRNRPSPDAVLRFQKKVVAKPSRDAGSKSQPFPEPIDRSAIDPGTSQPETETNSETSTTETETETRDLPEKGCGEQGKEGKGIYFGDKG